MTIEREIDIDDPFWREVGQLLRTAIAKSRGRAAYWKWPDQQLEEHGVAKVLHNFLVASGEPMAGELSLVEPDPPDILLTTRSGSRVGIEVTELVDRAALQAFVRQKRQTGRIPDDWVDWPQSKIAQQLLSAIALKDEKLARASASYDEYVVAIFTDEPAITAAAATAAIALCRPTTNVIRRAFLLLPYHPHTNVAVYPDGCAVVPIPINADGKTVS